MHGGFCTVETFAKQTPHFAAKYQVIVPERRGHGRTPDVNGPITYESMARDTIGFMQALGIPSAHLVGYSDGGNTALVIALKRPDLVRKMVCLGANFHYNGMAPVAQQVVTPSRAVGRNRISAPHSLTMPSGTNLSAAE